MKKPFSQALAAAPILKVQFYRSSGGNEPVRHWLRALSAADRKAIGKDITTVQRGWPLGMPLIRKLGPDLWEVRTTLASGIARVFFTVQGNQMVLLHSFIKKSQKTPQEELDTAKKRLKKFKEAS